MKKLLILILALVFLIGCEKTNNKSSTPPSIEPPTKETSTIELEEEQASDNRQTQAEIDYSNYSNDKRFSYVEQLTTEKQVAVKAFLEYKDYSFLYNFSPEEMVILYLHILSLGDTYSLYNITYNDGALPDVDTFQDYYNKHLFQQDFDMVFQYRYFDSIELQDTSEEYSAIVVITVSVGSNTSSTSLGLYKQDDIWKLDIYPSTTGD